MSVTNYLFTFFFLVLMLSCSAQKRKAVVFYEDVENGKQLEFASLKSPEWFLNHRSENRADKLDNWIIVNNSKAEFVYYGKLDLESIKQRRLVEFYKVSRALLEKQFPKYLSLDGVALNGILYVEHIKPIIQKELSSKCPNRYTLDYQDKYFRLKPKGIQAVVVMDAFCYNNPKTTYKLDVLLDKNNLKTLSKTLEKS